MIKVYKEIFEEQLKLIQLLFASVREKNIKNEQKLNIPGKAS